MSLAAAEEISVSAAVVAILLELDGIFTLIEEQIMAQKASLSEAFSPYRIWQ